MFVHPAQIAAIVARHPYITRARLVVDNSEGKDRTILHVELGRHQCAQAEAIEVSIRDITKLRGEVALHATGELPKDGRVIEDTRKPV